MIRVALALALVLLATAASALETPLTLISGNRVVLVDPAFGSMTVFDVSSSKVDRQGLGKPAGNFLADIQMMSKRPVAERDGQVISALRTGTENNKPQYGEYFVPASKLLPDQPTDAETKAGKAAIIKRAWLAENAFWKEAPEYDGVVRAVASSGFIAIAVPSQHAFLLYRLESDVPSLVAARNWGPDLFIPVGYNTSPSPSSLIKDLPADKQAEVRKAIGSADDEKSKDTAKDAKPDAPPADGATAALPTDEPPTPKSDVWLAATAGDGFLIVDLPNQHAMLYQFNGKQLAMTSVRNTAPDLIIARAAGGSLRSSPPSDKLIETFLASRTKQIKEFGLDTDPDYVRALLGEHQAKAAKASEFEGTVIGSVAMLNFLKEHSFLAYNCAGSQKIELSAARDYTADLAVAMYDQEIADRQNARVMLAEATSMAKGGKTKSGLLALREALALDPRLYKDAETKLKNVFREAADKESYQSIIDDATKKAEALIAADEARRKKLEDAKKKP